MERDSIAAGAPNEANAKSVLKKLRSEILLMAEGQFLGSGEDLSARFSISRPTLHQVVRALEHEQLVTARRGPNGGYYARRPSLNAAVAAVSTYLRASGTNLWHFVALARIVHADVCRRAAESVDEEKRTRLRVEMETFWNDATDVVPEYLLRRDYALEGLLFELADNPVVELFMRSMHHFWYEIVTQKLLDKSPQRVALWISYRRKLGEALLAHEGKIAVAIGQSHWDHLTQWLEDSMGTEIGSTKTPSQ